MTGNHRQLWFRWMGANALGELFGLGLTFLITAFAFSKLDSQQTLTSILLSSAFAVTSGAVEATIVGLAQWWAMHPWFPAITRLSWWLATLVGALLAYGLGYLPSTLMSMGQDASGAAPAAEPPQWLTLLLAAALGAVAGAVLSLAQWWVLRRHARRGWLWVPANMLAWAVGMPIIFWSIDLAFKMAAPWQSVLVIIGGLLVMGAAVGAIEGRFLMTMVPEGPPVPG